MALARRLPLRIPTLLGLGILIAGLVGGIFLIQSSDTTSFLPRAAPETTPKNVKITNLTNSTLTVSWVTDSSTIGFVRFGTNPNALDTTTTDDRDQSSGTTTQFRNHHITLRSLKANTTYYFKIGTGSRELYDNAGAPYEATTKDLITAEAKTVYGEVHTPSGGNAAGAIVYLNSNDLSPLSAVVQSSGSFTIPLSQARNKAGTGPASILNETKLEFLVLSSLDERTALVTTTFALAQPVPDITLGANQDFSLTGSTPVASSTPVPQAEQGRFSSILVSNPTEATESVTLSITYPPTNQGVVTDKNPEFKGTAKSGSKVVISLTSKATQTNTVTATLDNTWKWSPYTALTNGDYILNATIGTGVGRSVATREFSVILATATPAATITPTIATTIPTSTPEAETLPASGSIMPTIWIIIAGCLFLMLGTYVWMM